MADKTHEQIISGKRRKRYAFWVTILVLLISAECFVAAFLVEICATYNLGQMVILGIIIPYFSGTGALNSLVGSRLKMDVHDQYSDFSLEEIYNLVLKFATLHNQFSETRGKSIKIDVTRK